LKKDLQFFQSLGLIDFIIIYDRTGRPWLTQGSNSNPPLFTDPEIPCFSCHGTKKKESVPFTFNLALKNSPNCQGCHGKTEGQIGYVYAKLRVPEFKSLSSLSKGKYIIFYLLIGAVVLTFGAGYVGYYITGRLGRVKRAIDDFREGRPVTLEDNLNDEISELARAFNEMAKRVVYTEQNLKQSRAYLKNLLDNMTDMVILLDPEHRIRYANRATLEFLKKEEREVLGRTCHEVFHHSPVPCYEKDGREKEECGFKEAFKGRRCSFVHHHRIEGKERHFFVQYIPFKEKRGKIPYIIEMAREITENYKLNEEKRILGQFNETLQDTNTLEELFERLSLLAKRALKAQGCAIFLYDPKKGKLRLANHRYVNPSIVSHIEEIGLDECVT
ncbi:MAG: HAMP domain-containing protein, partial [Nitrospirae bacterium]